MNPEHRPHHGTHRDRENGSRSSEHVSDAATTWPGGPSGAHSSEQAHSQAHSHDGSSHARSPATDPGELMRRWDRIQAGFVDDPQRAVVEAEQLADQLLGQVRDALERERAGIVRAGHADGASTEDLRMCVKRYRALIDRLVTIV